MRLIGISGKAFHGKDTVAQMIADALVGKRRVVRVGFSDALKEECRRLHGWNGKKDAEGRALLQRVGVERRTEDENYWVKQAFAQMTDPETLYVIPDVRFKNEAMAILQHGGEVWRVTRYDPTTREPFDNGLGPEAREHISETQLDGFPFDRYLRNERLTDLQWQVVEAFQ